MSHSTPETIRLTGEPAVCSTDLFNGWWVVWRRWAGGSGTYDYGKIAVAAFPTQAMANEWISEAAHRSRDYAKPLNALGQARRTSDSGINCGGNPASPAPKC